MSDDRPSWPILSANKIGQQKSAVCHAKIRYFVGQENRQFLSSKSANFLDIGHHGKCLQREMNIYFSYFFCLLFHTVYFRALDGEKIMQLSFCDLHSAVVKLADIVRNCKR